MDFHLSPEHLALREEARRFADEVVAPGADARDRAHSFGEEVLQAAAAKGYLGLLVPKSYGGRDVGNFGQCLILEELARADMGSHVGISVHNSLVTGPIKQWGSEALKQRWLPPLASGKLIGAYALTEPHSGSDAAALSLTAVKDGAGYVLNGTKMWITTGKRADLAIVFARTNREAPKAKGISAFVVDLHARGVSAGKKENKLGIRSSETVQLFFEDVHIGADALLGELDKGFNYALLTLNGGRVGIATQAVGVAQACLDEVIAAFSQRTAEKGAAFGTQDQDFAIAEMATAIEASRLMVWRAALLRDGGVEHVREASMAKLLASKTANEVARRAVELVGPAAWTEGSRLERLVRDARITEIYEGTTEIQKLVIARTLKGS